MVVNVKLPKAPDEPAPKPEGKSRMDPTTAAVAKAKYRPAVVKGFPWVPVGSSIIVRFVTETIKKLKSGIFAVTGKEDRRRIGIVVAIGAGDYMPYIGFVSPQVHLGIQLRDIVFVETGVGIPMMVDGIEYEVLRPDDIRARLPEEVGMATRQELIGLVKEATKHHKQLGSEAGDTTTETNRPQLPDRDSLEESIGEHVEKVRSARGKRTKPQVLIDKNPLAKK